MQELKLTADIENSKITHVTVSRMDIDIASFDVDDGVFYLDGIYTVSPRYLFLSFKEVLDTEYGSEVVLYEHDSGDGMEIRIDQSLFGEMFD